MQTAVARLVSLRLGSSRLSFKGRSRRLQTAAATDALARALVMYALCDERASRCCSRLPPSPPPPAPLTRRRATRMAIDESERHRRTKNAHVRARARAQAAAAVRKSRRNFSRPSRRGRGRWRHTSGYSPSLMPLAPSRVTRAAALIGSNGAAT